jgi:hypothetical protein
LRRPDLTERQCYHYLENGIWPGVRKGGNWHLRPARLLEERRREEDEALAQHQVRRAEAKAINGEQLHPEEPRAKRRGRSPAKLRKGGGGPPEEPRRR